jgi:C-terminal processing protease CtpA/Prc
MRCWGVRMMRRVTELRVIDVLPDSEAANKGVRAGDALLAVDMKSCQVRCLYARASCLCGQVGVL